MKHISEADFLEQLCQCLTIMDGSLRLISKGKNTFKNLCIISKTLKRAIELFRARREIVQENEEKSKLPSAA